MEWKDEKWAQVAELTETVVKLDSFDYPQAYFLNALSNYYLKNMDAAEKSAREAVRLDTRKQFLTTIRLLGVILAQKQDYTGATEQFKSYLQLAPQASDAATVRKPVEPVGEAHHGQTVRRKPRYFTIPYLRPRMPIRRGRAHGRV